LVEKPVTFTVEELDELTSLAKKNGLFFMEAVWTRFQPIAQAVRDVIASGRLGRPKRFTADFSMDQDLSREFFDCIYQKQVGRGIRVRLWNRAD